MYETITYYEDFAWKYGLTWELFVQNEIKLHAWRIAKPPIKGEVTKAKLRRRKIRVYSVFLDRPEPCTNATQGIRIAIYQRDKLMDQFQINRIKQ